MATFSMCDKCGKMRLTKKTAGLLISTRAEKKIAAAAKSAFSGFAADTSAKFLRPGVKPEDVAEQDIAEISEQWLNVVQGPAVKAYVGAVKRFSPEIGIKFDKLIRHLSEKNLEEMRALAANEDNPKAQALLQKKIEGFIQEHQNLGSLLSNANVSSFEYILNTLLKVLLVLFYIQIIKKLKQKYNEVFDRYIINIVKGRQRHMNNEEWRDILGLKLINNLAFIIVEIYIIRRIYKAKNIFSL
jgi:hypothetical protein